MVYKSALRCTLFFFKVLLEMFSFNIFVCLFYTQYIYYTYILYEFNKYFYLEILGCSCFNSTRLFFPS